MATRPYIENCAYQVLTASSLSEKVALTQQTEARWQAGELDWGLPGGRELIEQPGRPARPKLVAPSQLPKRGLNSEAGRAALIHAIAHIELNAIDLAWDAVYRFGEWESRDIHRDFIADWLSVAVDEARHFSLLQERLTELGFNYGDFDAHNGLWQAAQKTIDDPMARMALVPRVLEARGLDVTPGMIGRLRGAGDLRTVEILELILREEVAHVAAGSRWFAHLCQQRGLEPEATFFKLLESRFPGVVRGPFNESARLAAGFSNAELEMLQSRSARS